jgi:hypothetical protein
VAAAGLEVLPIRRGRLWKEVAVWIPEHRALVCGDALGTVGYFRARNEPIGLHPLLRPRPPRGLGRYEPLHILVGHGEGIHGAGVPAELDEAGVGDDYRAALDRSRVEYERLGAAGLGVRQRLLEEVEGHRIDEAVDLDDVDVLRRWLLGRCAACEQHRARRERNAGGD